MSILTVYMCDVCLCADTYQSTMWSLKDNLQELVFFPNILTLKTLLTSPSPPYFLRLDLWLNLVVTNLARLTSQQLPGLLLILPSRVIVCILLSLNICDWVQILLLIQKVFYQFSHLSTLSFIHFKWTYALHTKGIFLNDREIKLFKSIFLRFVCVCVWFVFVYFETGFFCSSGCPDVTG